MIGHPVGQTERRVQTDRRDQLPRLDMILAEAILLVQILGVLLPVDFLKIEATRLAAIRGKPPLLVTAALIIGVQLTEFRSTTLPQIEHGEASQTELR